jgi:hypothetical protein
MSQATLTALPCLTLPAGELTEAELASLPLAKATTTATTAKPTSKSKQPRESKHPQQVAEEFHATLNSINEGAIPVMSRDRHIPRKEQAKLARELFKKLGLKGASITAPNYSMASTVDIDLPRLQIHVATMWPHSESTHYHECGAAVRECDKCPACVQNHKSHDKVKEILARAFPNHDDRSDRMVDYYDYCWSISTSDRE